QTMLQQALPPALMRRVSWVESLPTQFNGLVLANEVLDALPVHVIQNGSHGLAELGVTWRDDGFVWAERPPGEAASALALSLALPPDYVTEVCPAAQGLIASLAAVLTQGALL